MARIAAITGAGGAQARAIADAFERAGWRARRLSRRPGEGLVQADPETGEGLADALDGADALAFTLPQDHADGAMVRIARTVADAARTSGVERVVVNLGGAVDPAGADPFAADLAAASEAFGEARPDTMELMPTSYLDNFLQDWARGAIAAGALAYPAPADAPVAWLSHRALGDFAVAAAERGVPGRRYAVGGPEALTGPELARALAPAVGQDLAYAPIPGADFEAAMNAAMGPPAGTRLRTIYDRLRREPRAMAHPPEGWSDLDVAPEDAGTWAARQDWGAGPA